MSAIDPLQTLGGLCERLAMALNHIGDIAVLAVIVVASHAGGASLLLSSQGQVPAWKVVLNSAFVLALCVLLLSWRW